MRCQNSVTQKVLVIFWIIWEGRGERSFSFGMISMQDAISGSSSFQELHSVKVGPCCLDVGRTGRDSIQMYHTLVAYVVERVHRGMPVNTWDHAAGGGCTAVKIIPGSAPCNRFRIPDPTYNLDSAFRNVSALRFCLHIPYQPPTS